jgi:hypothetical protein
MTNEEKMNTSAKVYVFHREDGFYFVEIPEGTLQDNIDRNPGTIRVEDLEGNVLWN